MLIVEHQGITERLEEDEPSCGHAVRRSFLLALDVGAVSEHVRGLEVGELVGEDRPCLPATHPWIQGDRFRGVKVLPHPADEWPPLQPDLWQGC